MSSSQSADAEDEKGDGFDQHAASRRAPPQPRRPGACQIDDDDEVGGDEGERPGQFAMAQPAVGESVDDAGGAAPAGAAVPPTLRAAGGATGPRG